MAPNAHPAILPKIEAVKTEETGANLPSAVLCQWCFHPGCDVQLQACQCSFHARCCPTAATAKLERCPACSKSEGTVSLRLLAMTFEEIDFAKQQAARSNGDANKRGRKRKNATIARLTGSIDQSTEELRTGRWTEEETEYCDALIVLFEQGKLPIPNGLKLNEFLANMLKSKQSRLTKKMKNARLSSKQYQQNGGHLADADEAVSFSKLEAQFYASIKCPMERAEIRFHMQKEWREHFSNFCVLVNQPLDANAWLFSVEELDRRASLQKNNERMVRRKVMMGHALNFDAEDCHQRGVYIEGSKEQQLEPLKVTKEDRNPMKHYASPFIGKVLAIMKQHHFPFEHVDAWVPSFVQPGDSTNSNTSCRLCFAGCGTTKYKIQRGGGAACKMNEDEEFHLLSFGEYSQKFSFDVGSGLPGRVYSSGVASWEQGIQNAPLAKFERCGGASQWGIQTVLGVPIPSPSVGRIVLIFYSIHDRIRQLELVQAIAEDLNKLRPSPKWKLVVDVGHDATNEGDDMDAAKLTSLLRIVESHTPKDSTSPIACVLPGFTSLRLLLVKEKRSRRENNLLKSVLACYESYRASGRSEADTACMTARDFMALSKDAPCQDQVSQSTESTVNDNARQVLSGAVQSAASNSNTRGDHLHLADVNGIQYQSSSNTSQPQLLLSQLSGHQAANNGLSALEMAISLAHNGLQLAEESKIGSKIGSPAEAASVSSPFGAFVANQGISPALHPISSHQNLVPMAITGPLADLVHHDSGTAANMSDTHNTL